MALPTSLRFLPRRMHVFSTAAVVYLLLKLTSLLNRILSRSEERADAAWAAANTRSAERILRMANARRGLWIKCCQYVAARSDALPPQYAEVLSRSLDDCPPSPPHLVLQTVNEQLQGTEGGKRWARKKGLSVTVADLFHGFDAAKPIASASIAQVHVATVKESGRKVVLKVQHPGVRPMLLQDLADLKTLLEWVAGAEPKFDMRPVLDAWIDMVPYETNFLNEMKNLIAVKGTLRKAPAHLVANADVPEPLPEFTSDKLFVMEFIDGCKVTDVTTMDRNAVDRSSLVTEITRSFGNQLFVSRVFSGDPHPGNFLIHKLANGGTPVLLDFGICVNVSESTRLGFAKLILAANDSDSYSLIQSLGDVGVKLNRADPAASLDVVKYLFRTTSSSESQRQEQSEFKKEIESREKDIEKNERDTAVTAAFNEDPSDRVDDKKAGKKEKFRSPIDSFPGDLIFFFRSLGMLRGLATTLDVRHSYLKVLRPFAEYTLEMSCREEERLKDVVYRPVFTKGGKAGLAKRILHKVFQKLYDTKMMIGMQVAVYKEGKLALNMAAGQMGRYDLHPVKPNTVFNSFSSTKGLSAILFASIQDQYNVEYSDLVTKYWPEYAAGGKGSTTIGDILSHSAGLHMAVPEDMPMTRLRDDWQGIIRHLEQAEPAFKPGSKTEYHALTFGWLVAGLITKITGSTYQQNLKKFTKRLGIEEECYCGTMPRDLLPDVPGGRVAALSSAIFDDLREGPIGKFIRHANAKIAKAEAENVVDSKQADAMNEVISKTGDLEGQAAKIVNDLNLPSAGISKAPAYILDLNYFNHPVLRSGFVPSANGHFSARALAKLFGAVANDGLVERTRILVPGRARKMQEKIFDIDEKANRAWGAGLTLYDTVDKNGNTIQHGAVGHGGIGGSFAFAVPSEKFSMAVTLNKLNAVSLPAAIVIAAVCKAFGVPTPSWYHKFAEKAMLAFKDDAQSADSFADEAALMDRILNGDDDADIMKMLVG